MSTLGPLTRSPPLTSPSEGAASARAVTRPVEPRAASSSEVARGAGPSSARAARREPGSPDSSSASPFPAVDGDEAPSSRAGGTDGHSEAEERILRELRERDREVRAHEQAHKAAAGPWAGPITYTYRVGPDGKSYAVDGSVPIDLGPIPGDPAATARKMQQVERAALAVREPSAADRAVAAQASRTRSEAQSRVRAEVSTATREGRNVGAKDAVATLDTVDESGERRALAPPERRPVEPPPEQEAYLTGLGSRALLARQGLLAYAKHSAEARQVEAGAPEVADPLDLLI